MESAKDKVDMFNETFCPVFTRENLDNIPDKGQFLYQSMPNINLTLNGAIKYKKIFFPKKHMDQIKCHIGPTGNS